MDSEKLSEQVSEEAVAGWAHYFEEKWSEALEFRNELKRRGMRVPRELYAKQLGLSVALTPATFRCVHYGDTRVCPWCAGAQRGEVERLQARLDEKGATVRRQSEAITNQSRAIDSLRAQNEQLRGAVEQMQKRLAGQAKRRWFGRG